MIHSIKSFHKTELIGDLFLYDNSGCWHHQSGKIYNRQAGIIHADTGWYREIEEMSILWQMGCLEIGV